MGHPPNLKGKTPSWLENLYILTSESFALSMENVNNKLRIHWGHRHKHWSRTKKKRNSKYSNVDHEYRELWQKSVFDHARLDVYRMRGTRVKEFIKWERRGEWMWSQWLDDEEGRGSKEDVVIHLRNIPTLRFLKIHKLLLQNWTKYAGVIYSKFL